MSQPEQRRSVTPPHHRTGTAELIAALSALVASFVLGGLTSYAQGFLPDALSSFANSASGWTIITSILVFAAQIRWPLAAVTGAGSFIALTVGYAIVSTWRGYYYDPLMFSIIGIVVGPFVGVAACWLRSGSIRAALGTSLLAGIAIGEGIYGLTAVSQTTSPVYWVVIILLGVGLITYSVVRKVRGAVALGVLLATTAIVTIAFNVAYRAV